MVMVVAQRFETKVVHDSQNGDTALTIAAQHGRADCVSLLVEGGADMEAQNSVRAVAKIQKSMHCVTVCLSDCFIVMTVILNLIRIFKYLSLIPFLLFSIPVCFSLREISLLCLFVLFYRNFRSFLSRDGSAGNVQS